LGEEYDVTAKIVGSRLKPLLQDLRAAPLLVLLLLPLVCARAQDPPQVAPETGAPVAPQLVELFNGTLDNWRVAFTEGDNIRIVDGLLRVEGPNGWVRSTQRYTDFRLEIEFRWLTDDADSGVFLRASGDETFARGWPAGSYQVQLRNPAGPGTLPTIGHLFRHQMDDGPLRFDQETAREVALPTGEWQTLAIELVGERLAVWLNGTGITQALGVKKSRNFVGFQAERGGLEFRSVRIQER
jgi:hypothetical protein